MKAEEIKVGKTYRGGESNRQRLVLMKTYDYVKWSVVPSGTIGYTGLVLFCKWAKEEVS